MNTSSGSTSKCLTEKGTWASFTNNEGTVTSITLTSGSGITVSDTGTAITTSGSRTISISGMNTTNGSTAKCLTEKGTWTSFTNNDGTVTSITIKTSSPLTGGSDTATTTSGTYTIAFAKQVHNTILAGPSGTSDANAVPTFRALVAEDIPTLEASKVGLGNVSNNSNLNGVTGAKGDIIYWSAANTPAHLTNTSSTTKNFLSITSQVLAWTTLSASDVGLGNVTNAAQITKATFTEAYQIMYSTGASTPAVLTANKSTTKKFLTMTGASASAGAAPEWNTIVAADLPTITVAKGGLNKTSIAAYSLLYASAANTYAELTANTESTKKFISMTGTGSAGAAPTWSALTLTDIPAGIARGNGRVFYGTCSTAAGTAAKEAICASYDKVLTNGDIMIVKFDNTNSGAVADLTLSIKTSSSDTAGTTAKNIKRLYNTTGANNLNAAGELNKDAIAVFIYNGTYWILTNADYNNTYYYTSAYCGTAAATAAKVGTVSYHTAATAGKYFQVMMIYDNTAQSALTFSLGGSGNKPLYINGEVSSASNYTLPKGLYMVYYDGTNFYFRTDNKIDANVIGHDINAQYYAILDNSTPGVEKAHFVWNSTRQSIDFIFN